MKEHSRIAIFLSSVNLFRIVNVCMITLFLDFAHQLVFQADQNVMETGYFNELNSITGQPDSVT
jgi:hypothetical protein